MKKFFALLTLFISLNVMAQTKPAYSVSEITFINKDGYLNDYGPKVRKLYEQAGGVFIVGGGKSEPIIGLPKTADRITIAKFENYEKAKALFESKAYKDLRPLAEKYAKIRLYIIEGN